MLSARSLRLTCLLGWFMSAASAQAFDLQGGGTDAWLPAFGVVRVFRVVAPDGDTQHWFTNDLGMDELGRLAHAEPAW